MENGLYCYYDQRLLKIIYHLAKLTETGTMHSLSKQLTLIVCVFGLLAACAEERPPRSATEFLENPIMLEAAMVRCSQDRTATRYDAECVNAREAVRLIEAKEESARSVDLDAQSESKRQALRRTQEAAAQARRRVADRERLRKEAEYLAQFGVAHTPENSSTEEEVVGNSPQAVIPVSSGGQTLSSGPGDAIQATDGGNAPVIAVQPEEDEAATDLESIRDELQRRNEEGGN